MRASKYRHVFGQASKKELCYENLKITKNAWDSNIIQFNGKYIFATWDSSGGGAFAVIPVEEVGKAPDTVSLFRGHKGPVLDTAFDPFDLKIVASCSEDGEIYVWRIPDDYSFHNYRTEDDEAKDIVKPEKVLRGHTRKVGHIQFHPCAKDVLVSSSVDYSVKFWNVETATVEFTLQHPDMVTSFAFNYNGLLLATTSRDKKLRIWDLSTKTIISEAPGHTGAKPSRVTWLGNSNRICTTGFSRLSDRQVGIWDVNDLGKGSIDGFLMVDSSSGVLIPVFDESTSILYLAGKGDGNIRYFEFKDDVLFDLSQYASTDAQRGFAVAPKMYVNMKENEILKSFKTVNDNSIKPISFIVPRKSELFQEDIYPDARSDQPALSASEWFSGKVVSGPTLISMRKLFDCEPNQYVKEPEKMLQSKAEIKPTPQPKEAEKPSSKPTTEPNRQTTQVLDPPKTIDAFKSSSRVDDLLKRVELDTAQSEETEGTDDDSEWTEVRKPASVATESSLPSVERDSKKEKSVETDTILSQSMQKTKDASQEKPKEQESKHVIQKESKDVKQKESKQENHAEESKDKPRKAESVQEDTNGQTQS
ncbi:DUF1900-domain-containing protein [Metschnikowia bicuspidata]|uniref:Coronin n=1 Tax=Metschnikowia bicuspidata TaxID=27322 RepID=A0A4V1J3S1_9ASCO|nr:DUF1900-domain-containing protein [Metschnikowia bicuspidata]